MMALLRHGEFYGMRDVRRDVAGFSLAIASADPVRQVARHTHEDAHFILLLDGHYLSTARGAGHLDGEPALIYNPAATTHQDTFPDGRGRFLGLSLARARLAEAEEVAAPSDVAVRIWEPDALAAAQRIATAVVRAATAFDLEAACLELLGAFVRTRGDGRRPPHWLIRARELLHDRACEDLAMATVARDAGVHPVHLARSFRRFFGCTPADYHRRCRVERAAYLVRATGRPLADIAAGCGFVDQSHLTRAFARALGTSPGAYRKRYRR